MPCRPTMQSSYCTYVFHHQINKEAPLDKVCLLSCGICTGYGTAVNTAKVIHYDLRLPDER